MESAQRRLEEAGKAIEGVPFNDRKSIVAPYESAALTELGTAIRLARLEGESGILKEAFETRAELYLQRFQPRPALEDSLNQVAELGDSPEALIRIATAALACDEPELSLEASTRLAAFASEESEEADAIDPSLYLGRAHLYLAKDALKECEEALANRLAPIDLEAMP